MFDQIKQVRRFIEAFETGTLPRESWTHQAHFVVGLWYLLEHDLGSALSKMRRGVKAYNEASGVPNTDYRGYHESITTFYMGAIRDFLLRHSHIGDLVSLFKKIVEDEITHKEYLYAYYSRERIASVEARKGWVQPDKRRLPDHFLR